MKEGWKALQLRFWMGDFLSCDKNDVTTRDVDEDINKSRRKDTAQQPYPGQQGQRSKTMGSRTKNPSSKKDNMLHPQGRIQRDTFRTCNNETVTSTKTEETIPVVHSHQIPWTSPND